MSIFHSFFGIALSPPQSQQQDEGGQKTFLSFFFFFILFYKIQTMNLEGEEMDGTSVTCVSRTIYGHPIAQMCILSQLLPPADHSPPLLDNGTTLFGEGQRPRL